MAAAFWAYGHTGSVFIAIWCFFLTQALFVLIPARGRPDRLTSPSFNEAHRAADQAIARLAVR
jgi:hypothetical protein